MTTDLAPRVNHIFVDYENVQETDLDRIADKPVKVTLILGALHKQLPLSLVKKLLQYAGQVQLVETGRTGRNAADLVLANHIGEVRKADPSGYFHILSKDKDFDALIGYHNDNGTLAARHDAFSEIPVLMNLAERVQFMTTRFKKPDSSRPKLRKKLESHIQALFGESLSAEDVEATIKGLIAARVITLSSTGVVSYGASPSSPPPPAVVRAAAPPAAAKRPAAPNPAVPPVTLTELAALALERLRQQPNNRPKSKNKLVSFLNSQLGYHHPQSTIYSVIKNLRQAGYLSFIKQAVTYHF